MARTVQKTLTFPLAGVSRSRGYREQTRPYAAPWAVNVRGAGPLERRLRGGSRPGLVKVNAADFGAKISAVMPVTSLDSSGVRHNDLVVIADGVFSVLRGSTVSVAASEILSETGVAITSETGVPIVFDSVVSSSGQLGADVFDSVQRNGRLLIADATLREYDPQTGVVSTVPATSGTIPAACPLICLYRDRLFLSGSDHVWYASRQGDITDWSFGDDLGDVGRAVAGQVERSGMIGEPITAMIPRGDTSLLFASQNALWMLRGDPATGTMLQVSPDIGVLSPTAWAVSPGGVVAFLSNDGVYLMGGADGDYPRRFSAERMPESLVNVDAGSNSVIMCYDVAGRGFHLFVTPPASEAGAAVGQHWWLDLDNKALWPVVLQEEHQPVAACRMQGTSTLADVVLGCRDGYLRKFSGSATTDDGTDIESHILIGPFRLTSDDLSDAVLAELHGILADNSGPVTWRVVMAQSAEEAADVAVAGVTAVLAGAAPVGVSAFGTWAENRNKVVRPRARGPWAVVWLSSSDPWAFEAVAVQINQLGRLR